MSLIEEWTRREEVDEGTAGCAATADGAMAAQRTAQAVGQNAADRGHRLCAHTSEAPAPYLEHGFLDLDYNAAGRVLRPIVPGRTNYLFMGSPAGGKIHSIAYALIETAKLNGLNSQV